MMIPSTGIDWNTVAAAVGGCCTTNAENIRQVADIRDKFVAMNAKTVTYKGV